MFSLKGKVAIVTGGASGIGKAVAQRFAQAGASIVIADLDDAQGVAQEIGGVFMPTNVSQEGDIVRTFDATVEQCGGLDIVINNAGIAGDYVLMEEATLQQYQECFDVNALGVAYGIKHAGKHMKKGGAIVNTASLAGIRGSAGIAPYVASKFGVVGMTKTAAIELAPQNIRVNCICPGPVQTPMLEVDGAAEEAAVFETLAPLARVCKPEEFAATAHFLCAEDCNYITGQAIHLCGGMTAGVSAAFIDNALDIARVMKEK